MFFLFDSLSANKGAWHIQNNQKNRKGVISPIFQEIF